MILMPDVASVWAACITNEELASAAGSTLFDASRFLSEWQRSGALAKTRGKVLLSSADLLFREVRK